MGELADRVAVRLHADGVDHRVRAAATGHLAEDVGEVVLVDGEVDDLDPAGRFPREALGQTVFGVLPKKISSTIMNKVGLDRMAAIYTAIDAVRRGGTISLIGVYGGQSDPMPMLTLFDKQIQLRMGQANVKRWVDDIMPLLVDDSDPLGTEDFATHQVPLSEAPQAYENFQKKADGTVKVVFKPGL